MNILYVGDIMGKPGRELTARVLPDLRQKHKVDLVIAQGENVTHGKGLSPRHMRELQKAGVDFFTGGNHILARSELHEYLEDSQQPVIRPANYPSDTPGKGYKFIETSKGKILVISLLGQIVGKDAHVVTDNPLETVDDILKQAEDQEKVATVVNFHGDYSSEKRVIGYFLDGRVTAVVGDHWHVPSADAMVLPKGTAHVTDVGMVGSLHSSLGIKTEIIIKRWQSGQLSQNILEEEPPYQFCALLMEVDNKTGLAQKVRQIVQYYEN